ncbi:TPM domain-containing protein [Erythrobacter sp. EC-HK427]|uniref:TPM domain-containing protein n=1 Tax=Erythrobacter sp. EC-HK427 TaxID=2038396 RepID=UPI0012512F26|nr:TPM domain-containing protein [Erythrobacter sp. EC-HK427]VVT20498.1 conserved exported hypothetical protein [Erythrobacter sp. EC-HK427]
MRRIFLLLAALFAALASPVSAQTYTFPPAPSGPVLDSADMLSPQAEAALDQRLRDYNRETGRAIIVATVPVLQDTSGRSVEIEPYATALFAEWGIGGAERDMGLLLLISRDDRRMRIEVGYGLHPWFGGIMAGRIINDVISPRFKAGDFDGGVTSGVDAILAHLATSPEDAIAIEEAAQAAAAQERSEGGFPIGTLIWLGFLFFFFILPLLGGRGRRRRYRSGVGGVVGDIILWEAGKAIARGITDNDDWGGGGFGGGFGGGGGGGGFGGFGGGMSGGGGASGGW